MRCVKKNATKRAPLPGNKVFRCTKLNGVSRRQCADRRCHRITTSVKEKKAPRGRIAEKVSKKKAPKIAEKVKKAKAVLPPLPPAAHMDTLFVALAMSHERLPDRIRLLELLKQYQFVLGVSNIEPPITDAGYKELEPYVSQGRYKQIKFDFKEFRAGTQKSPNSLFEAMHSFDVPVKIVSLDYFFLQHPYYVERYGMNWLLDDVNQPKRGQPKKKEGKVRELFDHGATQVFLPVDKRGLMKQMVDEYAAFRAKTMAVQFTPSSPLFESDERIAHIPDKPSAKQEVEHFLNVETPFLQITPI
jgi:hypothetical protein